MIRNPDRRGLYSLRYIDGEKSACMIGLLSGNMARVDPTAGGLLDSQMLSPNTILRERYRIISEIGHGGMGAVYQAMDENLNCLVVVKETFATNDEQRQAFRREAQLLANLSHPNLPKVMDHFTHDQGQFLVMQFVTGHDLAELMELREQPFAVEKVLGWAEQLLDALEELHSYDPPIVHRDIKPSNLKVTPKGRVVLLDFGLAKGAAGQMSTAEADSQPKSIYGYTRSYAPLEQIRGAGTDPRSDLYSLAATLWSLLTGSIPPDALARVGDKEEGKPDPLRPACELNPKVPVAVSEALNLAMSLNRNQRPANATELRSALLNLSRSDGDDPQQQSLEPKKIPVPTVMDSATKITEPVPAGATRNDQPLPTMHGVKPPSVSSQEVRAVPPTVASRSAGGDSRKSLTGALLIAGAVAVVLGVLVIAIAIIALKPWKRIAAGSASSPAAPSGGSSSAKPIKEITNKIGMRLTWIPPGSFMMGLSDAEAEAAYEDAKKNSTNAEHGWFTDAEPKHLVTIREGFYMGQFEITQGQWQRVMGTTVAQQRERANLSTSLKEEGDNYPMYFVSWDDAQAFITRLNQANDGYLYRLPTEAEWEYAERAGSTTLYTWGADIIRACEYANVADRTAKENKPDWSNVDCRDSYAQLAPVGSYKPNAFGLYDTTGNVGEWCQDTYKIGYAGLPTDGSAWLGTGDQKVRVVRGGSWYSFSHFLLAAYRFAKDRDFRDDNFGFRVAAVRKAQ